MALSEAQKDKMFNGVWSGKITERKLPKDYYLDTSSTLNAQIKKGFGVRKVTDKTKYVGSITEMSENAQIFSSAKTYQMTRELADAKKAATNKKEYKEAANKIYDKYERWGVAEKNTMMASAQSCKKWQQIEADKDVLPKLRYSTIGDACDICRPLDNTVAPVDSPFWSKYAPTNHFNCLCVLIQEPSSVRNTAKNKLSSLDSSLSEIMDDTFINNVGKTNEAFPRHAYFDIPKKDVALAKRNFDMPIQDIKNMAELNELYEQV